MATFITNQLLASQNLNAYQSLFMSNTGSVLTSGNGIQSTNATSNYLKISINGTVASSNIALYLYGTSDGSTTGVGLHRVIIGETGVVTGMNSSPAIMTAGSNNKIVNHGQISTVDGNTILMQEGSGHTINNQGTISGQTASAIALTSTIETPQGLNTIENGGTITGAKAIYSDRNPVFLMNSGLISGTDTYAIHITSLTAGSTIRNTGIIRSTDTAISTADGNDIVVNSGSITGDIYLGGGNDKFDGRDGSLDGTVYGGFGDDQYFVNSTHTSIIEYGGQGTDHVYSEIDWQLLSNQIENLTLLGTAITGVGNARENHITGNSQDNRLYGYYGNDDIGGGDGNDLIYGGYSNDLLAGDKGNDVLKGGVGNDSLYGGEDDDILRGGSGNDTLSGQEGDDYLLGGKGTDVFHFDFGTGGQDRIYDIHGNADRLIVSGRVTSQLDFRRSGDKLVIESGGTSDRVVIEDHFAKGHGRMEILQTTTGSMYLQIGDRGGATNDILVGHSGNQTIKGLGGNDILIGKGGKDKLYGGTGLDRFDYDDLSDSGTTSTTMDTIYDFVVGLEKIDLYDIDANANIAGDQAFNFIGSAAYSGSAGELRYQTIGGNTRIGIDVDGDSVDDFNILMAGNLALGAGDFIL